MIHSNSCCINCMFVYHVGVMHVVVVSQPLVLTVLSRCSSLVINHQNRMCRHSGFPHRDSVMVCGFESIIPRALDTI